MMILCVYVYQLILIGRAGALHTGLQEHGVAITTRARERRQEDSDPAITGRADFIGYELDYDNTYK